MARNTPLFVIQPRSPESWASILAVERKLGYAFIDKRLLEEALTHASYNWLLEEAQRLPSYQRLEFWGDAVLRLALTEYVCPTYPDLDEGELSLLREANLRNETLARVAIRHDLYPYVIRKNTTALDDKVREFAAIFHQGDDNVVADGGPVKAPKVLADIVESIAAAIYLDVNHDIREFWMIFRGLLEPIVTLQDLLRQLQPVRMLLEELCQKAGKHLHIKDGKRGANNIAKVYVYVDGVLVASSSSKVKSFAKLKAAKLALAKLSKSPI